MINFPTIPNPAKQSPNAFGNYLLGNKESNPGGQITNLWNNIYYRIYIRKDWQLIQMPVNPRTIKTDYPPINHDYWLLGQGDMIINRKPDLKRYSWEGLFMKNYSDPLNNPGVVLPPYLYILALTKILEEEKPVVFTANSVDMISGILKPETFYALITDFEYEERGGEPGDFYYKIELTQFKEARIKQYQIQGPIKPDGTMPGDQPISEPDKAPNEGNGIPTKTDNVKTISQPDIKNVWNKTTQKTYYFTTEATFDGQPIEMMMEAGKDKQGKLDWYTSNPSWKKSWTFTSRVQEYFPIKSNGEYYHLVGDYNGREPIWFFIPDEDWLQMRLGNLFKN